MSPSAEHSLITRKSSPYNAEPHPNELIQYDITPVDLIYHRNHSEIPSIPENWTISIQYDDRKVDVALDELRSNSIDLEFAMQCAGNRRREMNEIRKVEGIIWDKATLSNCIWTGPTLLSLITKYNLLPSAQTEQYSVEFESLNEECEEDDYYHISIPLSKVIRDQGSSVIIAHSLNGKPIPEQHGVIRVIAGGYAGVRSVKWLCRIIIKKGESEGFYQTHDYKVLPEIVRRKSQSEDWWDKVPALLEMPIQSVICTPQTLDVVSLPLRVAGYAIAQGEDGPVKSVELQVDDGPWKECKITYNGPKYAWTLWEIIIESGITSSSVLRCRAADVTNKQSPENATKWNLRGVACNKYSEIRNLKLV